LVTPKFSLPPTQSLLDQISRILPDVHLSAYDGSESGPATAHTSISFNDPKAFARILRAPRGLGLARAWIAGEIAVEGDLHYIATHEASLRNPKLLRAVLTTAIRTALALGYRDMWSAGPTAVEYRPLRHPGSSIRRNLEQTEFHYGLSAQFYRHLLGPSMVYSCGIFAAGVKTLEDAQDRKHELICAKLHLDPDSHVLDIGCGWGSCLNYATERHGCQGTGITASHAQYQYAINTMGTAKSIRFLYGDYRRLLPVRYPTAAASIGMYEHVGEHDSPKFFRLVRESLPRGSRYLNQAIVWPKTKRHNIRRNAFVDRYIFPGGQLMSLSRQLRDLEAARFRVTSVETFGQSYAATIRGWIANLTRDWDACIQLEGEERVRAWYMYLTGALTRFEDRSIDLAQVLAEAR
jgi:cyclopropane-fatty-acyl-phospholipid synthase